MLAPDQCRRQHRNPKKVRQAHAIGRGRRRGAHRRARVPLEVEARRRLRVLRLALSRITTPDVATTCAAAGWRSACGGIRSPAHTSHWIPGATAARCGGQTAIVHSHPLRQRDCRNPIPPAVELFSTTSDAPWSARRPFARDQGIYPLRKIDKRHAKQRFNRTSILSFRGNVDVCHH